MAKEQYIAGLDVGTQSIRVVQAKLDESTGALSIVGAAQVPSGGIRKGVIVDIDEAVSSITSALEKVERMTGMALTSSNVAVGGNHIACLESRGVIAVSRADGEITENDIIRVVDASQAISIPPNREIIHVIPKTFTLDGQTGIKDPLGMTGIRLEVDTLLVHGSLPFLKNLGKAIMQTGLEIDQMVLAPLAASNSVLSKRQKELGVVLVDMGAGTTSIAVFEESNLLHTAVIPLGGMHVTNDIAIGLRCTIDTAEKVKLQFGHSNPKSVDKHAEIDLGTLDPEEHEKVSLSHVAEIIEARLEEIFEFVERELKLINRDGKLPAGVVLTGGGSKLPGISEFVKKQLRLPTQIGSLTNIDTIIDQVKDPAFATVSGLALWGGRFSGPSGSSGMLGGFSGLLNNPTVNKIRKLFKSFLP